METIWTFFSDNVVSIGILAGLAAILEFFLKPLRLLVGWLRPPAKVDLSDDTIKKIAPNRAKDGPALTIPEFIRIRRELKADLEAELVQAADAEKAQLFARIAELESQIANPDAALAEANKRIADLEALLEREGDEIAPDRIADARAALEAGDFSLADDIFAEIEVRAEQEVQRAARAAFGRGEVAEQEIRWADAAVHYTRAAQYAPSYRTLTKAHEFNYLAGDYTIAKKLGADLVEAAQGAGIPSELAMAKSDYALTLLVLGNYKKSEELCREAIEIDRANNCYQHEEYATHLNNLALVLEAQGCYEEAVDICRDALEVARRTIGYHHPNYAMGISNLAMLLSSLDQYGEAEAYYLQALDIDRATIGAAHPDFAIHLNNLAGVVKAQGRLEEAESFYLDALKIMEATLPAEHPNIQTARDNLAALRADKQ